MNDDTELMPRPSRAIASVRKSNPTLEVLQTIIDKGLELIDSGAMEIKATDLLKAIELQLKYKGGSDDDFTNEVARKLAERIPDNSPLGRAMHPLPPPPQKVVPNDE